MARRCCRGRCSSCPISPDGRPVCGLPGCVMYAKRTIFDICLPYLLAGRAHYRRLSGGAGQRRSMPELSRLCLAQLRLWKVRSAMESLESALKILLEHAGTPTETQELPLLEALLSRGGGGCDLSRGGAALRPFAAGWLRPAQRGHRRGQPGATPHGFSVIGEACAGCGEVFHPGPGGGCARHDGCARCPRSATA